MPTPPTRYHALDALRGTMMLLGIYLHAAVAYDVDGGWPWKQAELTRLLGPSMAFIHVFRMPLFYAMAGFFAVLLVERRGLAAAAANRVRRILLPFVLGWLVIFPMVAFLVMAGRFGIARAPGVFATGRFLGQLHPLHLWFLEYLVVLYALGGAALLLLRRLPGWLRAAGDRAFRTVAGAWWGPFALAVPSFLVLLAMPRAELQDPPGFLPLGRIVLAYAIPFGFGAMLYRHADLLGVLRRRAWVNLALACLALVFYLGVLRLPVSLGWLWYARRIEHSWALWLLVFGVTGAFLRCLDRPNATLRYLCDSSYFLYLAHMPMLIALQLLLVPLPWPPVAKAAVALLAATGALLVIYHWLVRPTALGAALNGRRVQRTGSAAGVARPSRA